MSENSSSDFEASQTLWLTIKYWCTFNQYSWPNKKQSCKEGSLTGPKTFLCLLCSNKNLMIFFSFPISSCCLRENQKTKQTALAGNTESKYQIKTFGKQLSFSSIGLKRCFHSLSIEILRKNKEIETLEFNVDFIRVQTIFNFRTNVVSKFS